MNRTRPHARATGGLAILLLLVSPRVAAAHEYWLAPSAWDAVPGRAITLGAVAGTGFHGEKKPFNAIRCVRFNVRTTKTLDLTPVALNGELAWASFAPSDAGGAMVAFESDFTPITLDAPLFDKYLALEGLDAPAAARRKLATPVPGRERYRRCAKAWLAGGDATRATAVAGMPLELVPLGRPGADPALRVRVLWQGRPLAGVLVKSWRTALGANGQPADPATRDSVDFRWQGRTDARGEVTAPLAADGEWLLSAVHMEPSPDPSADWESTWASLAFARRGGSARR